MRAGQAKQGRRSRLYDPRLGRMLSADPIVQEPHNAQNLNRYTYVLNNPLSYTDPTGLSFWRKYGRQIAGIMITAFLPGAGWFSGIFGSFSNVAAGFISGVVSSGNLQGGLWGAFSAGLFEGIGAKFADVVKENVASKVANLLENGLTRGQFAAKVFAHGMAGGVMSALQGGKFGHGFLSAGVTQAASMRIDGIDRLNKGFSAARVVAAAMVGGTVSAATGGKFANGALTAAFARAHNDESHHQDNDSSAFSDAVESVSFVIDDYISEANRFITSPSVVNVVAGFGDAASLGLSEYIRSLWGVDGGVNKESAAYLSGAASALVIAPSARGAYVFQAGRLGVGVTPTASNALDVYNARVALKAYYRGSPGLARLHRWLSRRDESFDSILARKGPEGLIARASVTNNWWTAGIVGSSAVNATRFQDGGVGGN